MPSNGIFARVLQEGEISVRDTIQVLPETGKEPFRAAVITLSDKGAAGERSVVPLHSRGVLKMPIE